MRLAMPERASLTTKSRMGCSFIILPGIQNWIKANGGLQMDGWMILSGKELKRFVAVRD